MSGCVEADALVFPDRWVLDFKVEDRFWLIGWGRASAFTLLKAAKR